MFKCTFVICIGGKAVHIGPALRSENLSFFKIEEERDGSGLDISSSSSSSKQSTSSSAHSSSKKGRAGRIWTYMV